MSVAGGGALRRSHSFRRTMRKEEPGMLKTTLREVEPSKVLAVRNANRRSGDDNGTREVRKVRSMVNWTNATSTPSPVHNGQKENMPVVSQQRKVMSSPPPNLVDNSTQKDVEASHDQPDELDKRLWQRKLRNRASFLVPFKRKTGDTNSKPQTAHTDSPSTTLF